MKNILLQVFAITLAIFIILGIVTVAAQTICIFIGNGALANQISNTVQTHAINFSGICAVISFIYLMIGKDAFKNNDEA